MPRRRTILVADDSELFRELESVFLTRAGHVITERDGEAALATLRRERPALAVLDLELSRLPGDEVCRVVKTDPELRDTPVVIVVADNGSEGHERAVRAGADDVVTKPISRVTLVQAVNRLLRTRRSGLVRVPLETAVRMRARRQETWGTSRNLSRGGMFVQADLLPTPETEIELTFHLPDGKPELSPTALVVWSRKRLPDTAPGVGLQFLRLDRESVDRIDDFVHQYAAPGALWSAKEG